MATVQLTRTIYAALNETFHLAYITCWCKPSRDFFIPAGIPVGKIWGQSL